MDTTTRTGDHDPGPGMNLGDRVVYRLTDADADLINQRRAQPGIFGNPARQGDEYPAVIVRAFTTAPVCANLQVFLDGNDSYWATSRTEGENFGQWTRMPSEPVAELESFDVGDVQPITVMVPREMAARITTLNVRLREIDSEQLVNAAGDVVAEMPVSAESEAEGDEGYCWPDYSTPEGRAVIDNQYTYHPPTSDEVKVYQDVRARMRDLAHYLDRTLPGGADKFFALDLVDLATMKANAAIARNSR